MNMDITQSESGGVTVTPPAKEKIAELLSGADQSQSAVRVFVSGGGCGGMNYGMTFAESVEETDNLIQDDSGCSIAIDPVALAYLDGAEIDFQDDGVSATFVFNNVFKAVGGSGACGGCGGAH